jgi:hypothetical protein
MFLNQYMLLLGEFDTEQYDNGTYSAIIWVVFFFATFISQVIIFNMLIAIMSDSYAKISEMREQAALKEKIQILCDYLRLVSDKNDQDSMLVFMKPSVEGDEGWGGILDAMKKNVQRSVDQMSKLFNRRFNSLSMEVADIRSQNTSVNDKLEDVQNGLTKQEIATQSQLEEVKSALAGSR